MGYNQGMRGLMAVMILVGCDKPGPRNNPAPSPPTERTPGVGSAASPDAAPPTVAPPGPADGTPPSVAPPAPADGTPPSVAPPASPDGTPPSVAPPAAPPTVAPPASPPPPGAAPGDDPTTGPPPALPSVTVPPGLLTAPPWIGRTFRTGLIAPRSTLTTWTLQRAGDQALLTIDERVTPNKMSEEIGPWSPVTTRRYLGTAKTSRASTTFTFATAGTPWTLICTSSGVVAAEPTAIRRPGRRKPGEEECGDRGQWSPARTRSENTLRCREPGDDVDDTRGGDPDLRLAREPGIEYLYVNDDCSMQGGGYRRIPKDGSVSPPRSSLP